MEKDTLERPPRRTTCFKEKSNLVKFLIFLLVVLIIVLIALFINLVIRKDDHACHSESCIKASAEIMRYIDHTINPCDDFYAFVCGNSMDMSEPTPPEPEEELSLMIMNAMTVNYTKPFTMQKLFYQSCLDLGAIDLDEDETILYNFDSLGDWPVLRGASWNGTFFDWVEVVKKSRRLGMKIDWFLEFSVYEDRNDTGTNILKIGIPRSLRRIREPEKAQRKDLFTNIANVLKAPKYLAHYETAKTIEFEDELAALVETHLNDEVYRFSLPKLTVHDLQLLWPYVQWLELLNNITNNRMDGNSYVIFNNLDYLRDLNKLILGTPKRIVADYMMWKIVEEYWQYLSMPIRQMFQEYNENVFNQQPDFDRQKFCLQESKKQFPLVAESVYIRRHVTEQKRQLVRDMLYTIKQHYIRLLEKPSSINREMRRASLQKLENAKFLIGGPEEVFDQFRFADNLGLYGFAFKSSNVIDMLNERRERFYDKYFSAINRGIVNNTIRFYEKVINITEFSVINQDTIIIPAALLQDTFYNPNLPNYLNYGTLGKVLANKIFDHIFQRKRLTLSDEEYDLNWRNVELFAQQITCLMRETTFIHNSELRQPARVKEFLPDFVAVDVAYESYDNWLRMLSDEFTLPALKYTPHQLFWIQMSKPDCSKIRTRHHTDKARFKIDGPLRSSRNFAKDFQCPDESKMNPRKKCQIL